MKPKREAVICWAERRYGALIPSINHNHVPLYLTFWHQDLFLSPWQRLGFCPTLPPSSLRLRGWWIKSYWKLSDASLCLTNCCVGKTVTRSVYHCIIILRIFWLGHGNIHNSSKIWRLHFILSNEMARYLTMMDQMYNLMWKVLRWSQWDESDTMRQKVPDFLIVFCPHMKLSEARSDPCYLIELIIWHLGHPAASEILIIKDASEIFGTSKENHGYQKWFVNNTYLTMTKIW